jgi:predicted HTH transcriptional regulator
MGKELYEDVLSGIYKTETFLIRFLANLLLQGSFSLRNRDMHILADTVNDTVKPQNDTVNDTVFSCMKQNPNTTAKEISEHLHISLSTVRRRIKELRSNGRVERIGSDKTGYWRVIE